MRRSGDGGQGEILGFDRRRVLVTVAIAAVLGLGTIALIGRAADLDEVLDALRSADKAWLPLGLGGIALAYAGYIVAYRDVARANGGPCFGFWTVGRLVAIGFGANLVGSAPAGFAVDFWALRRARVPLHEAARRVLALNTQEWAVLGIAAAAAGLLVLAGWGEAPASMSVAWLVVVPACLVAAVWVSSPSRRERLTEASDASRPERRRPLGAWLRWAGAKARRVLADAIGGVVVVRHVLLRPHCYPGAFFGYPLYWAGHLVTLFAGLRAFGGGHVSLAALVLAFATGYAATALPLPAGGSGGIEAALTFSLNAAGVELAPALLGVLLYRFFTFWVPILPALVLLPSVRTLNDELPGTPRSAAAGA